MPTYEYECGACKQRHEAFQSMTQKPLKKCPACGKSQLTRLIGAGAGFLFKGSGFYSTDYRSDSYKEAAKSDASGACEADPASGSCAAPKCQPPEV